MVNPNIIYTFAKNNQIMAKKNTSKSANKRKESDDYIELDVCLGNYVGYGCDSSYKTYKGDIPMSYRTKTKASKTKVNNPNK